MKDLNYEYEIAELAASPLASIYRGIYGEAQGEEMTHEIWKTLKKYGRIIVPVMKLWTTEPGMANADTDLGRAEQKIEDNTRPVDERKRRPGGSSGGNKELTLLGEIIKESTQY
jgi:hypothetical protein